MDKDLSSIRPSAPTPGCNVEAAKAAYITVARHRYTKSTYDIEIDDNPRVGITEDGAWVAAWLWVSQEEVGLCEEEAASCCET